MNGDGLEDDPSIRDECELLRRVPLKRDVNIVWDDNQRRWRPSSASFQDHPNGSPMSVVLGDALVEAGRSALEVLAGHDGFGLAAIHAGTVRDHQLGVVKDPLPSEPAHGLVTGDKKRRKVSRQLAKLSRWVVPPDIN
ncbi:MAG: hypothetical protein OXF72_07195 [Gammaproteobacteria bacterium]|nr:hypothetical protein [Gammaproteobacteria bacterium]MCY4278134.1 hypothetical protein [Gammaproteobacteria bacterium]